MSFLDNNQQANYKKKLKRSPKSLAILSVIDRHAHERLIYIFKIKLTPFKHLFIPFV